MSFEIGNQASDFEIGYSAVSELSVRPDACSEVDPEGCQDAVTERWAGGCGQQVAKATQSSLCAHQINASLTFGVGFAALLSSVLLHMLPDQHKIITAF